MKKVIKVLVLILFIGFAGIQFIRPNRSNPPIKPEETLENSTKVSGKVENILKRSCKDCHSNQTNYPWYSNIAPFSWSIVDHIRVGRVELNFSKWATYSKQKKERKLEEICEEVEEGSMPHNQYLWIHWEAELTKNDIKTLCDWTKKEISKLGEE